MPRKDKTIFYLLFALFVVPSAQAATINAASCNASDVLNALNSVTMDGTTVVIPAGTCTWTTQVAYTQVYSMTIMGLGNPTGSSSDGLNNPTGYNDQTIIYDDAPHTGNPDQTFSVTTAAGKSFRVTGISFLTSSSQTNQASNGIIAITGNSHLWRFDHNHVVPATGGSKGLFWGGWLWGVVDHNYFQITSGNNANLIEITGGGWNGASEGEGHASWADVSYFGGEQNVFVENNTFSAGTAWDCEQGGRMVFRYNTLINDGTQTHGTGHDSTGNRGCRMIEAYANIANTTGGVLGYPASRLFDQEGGAGLFWDNTLSGFYSLAQLNNVRTNTVTYGQTAPPNGWGYCGSAVTGVTSVWDENLDSSGRACLDGVGAGKGDLLTGSTFPSVVDSVTGTQTWPHQAAEPLYFWGNTVGSSQTSYVGVSPTQASTYENYNYYLELPNYSESTTFNGTAGIGCGPSSGVGCSHPVAQPSTCTVGVGYWNPANSTLYICGSGNTWNAYYTPYTYPHPLVSGSTPPPPPPATSACDVNGDGVVNVADVQLEVNMALGITTPCPNADGCTVVQVQRVVNAALGGSCVAP